MEPAAWIALYFFVGFVCAVLSAYCDAEYGVVVGFLFVWPTLLGVAFVLVSIYGSAAWLKSQFPPKRKT